MATRPANKFEIKIDGKTQDVKMSFALLQEVLKAVPEPAEVGNLLVTDFHLRDYVVRRVLTGNKKVREEADLIDLFEIEIEPEDVDDLMLWVVDHVLYFFMNTAAKTLEIGKKYRPEVEQLTQSAQSQTGSQD